MAQEKMQHSGAFKRASLMLGSVNEAKVSALQAQLISNTEVAELLQECLEKREDELDALRAEKQDLMRERSNMIAERNRVAAEVDLLFVSALRTNKRHHHHQAGRTAQAQQILQAKPFIIMIILLSNERQGKGRRSML